MGYELRNEELNEMLAQLKKEYLIYAPKYFKGGGRFSDTDSVRYGEVSTADEIVFDKKAEYSFKEVLLPISQTLFYFTEDEVKEADAPKKGAIVFLRSCDLHGVKRLDEMYLNNGPSDHYYKRLRENVIFVLMGCEKSFDSCFCVDMGTNISDNYDMSIDRCENGYQLDCKSPKFEEALKKYAVREKKVTSAAVTETKTRVNIPANLSYQIANASLWREYDSRCINCGRCNFVCPTCTCFTMQDIFYTDNGRAGERRRVWASCMVDGYTDVAGGGNYRSKNGDRMRFKVLHKVLDYKERNGYHMCVGCGRCDDICPEYISFSNCINKLENGMKEVLANE
ncbi:anaerobic sulfite reductase subunit AsrA [Konateibacter massiliensis]|uniref:anaerobic sulfite reductase subunit AsrA n=1 Tax=Konateibacter massiliensis TaxID=2002841 RepID=UPI000C159727|nr:anaerobic sulfite reductase subunit AsrA [Konateibacter massiliensis]